MRLLLRFSVFIVLFGFVGGWWLRRAAGGGRLFELLLVSFVPWLLHLLYALIYAANQLGGASPGLALTGLVSLFAALALLRFSRQIYRSDPRLAASVPLILSFIHMALLGFWLAVEGRAQGLAFGALTNLYLVAATLFSVAALLGYTWSLRGALRARLSRRR